MRTNLLIRSGRVIDPKNRIDAKIDILIENGKIAKVGKNLKAPGGAKIFDAEGCIAAPGFIDLHTHLREPGYEYKETIETGAQAAAAGGFTAICCMPNTDPVNDDQSVTKFITERAKSAEVNVIPVGAVSKDLKGEELAEIGDMVEAGVRAISDDGNPVADGDLMRRALEYAKIFDIPVINHAEDLQLAGNGQMNESEVSAILGLRGIPEASESVMVARDIALCEITGARLHIPHISSRGALDAVRSAKKKGLNVTCEVTPHHLILTDSALKTYDTNAKVKPPLRAEDTRRALVSALADGTIDAIATDHAPHHWDEKTTEFALAPFGLVGLETAVSLILDRFVRTGIISLERFVKLFSLNPARILKLKNKGHLSVGADADITILDTGKKIVVDSSRFKSRSKNTPFNGLRLTGAPRAAIVGGRVV